jgi:hypothetical protein
VSALTALVAVAAGVGWAQDYDLVINSTYQLFFSHAKPGAIIWGVGSSMMMPSASDPLLRNENWSMGPQSPLPDQ